MQPPARNVHILPTQIHLHGQHTQKTSSKTIKINIDKNPNILYNRYGKD